MELSAEDCRRILDPAREQDFRRALGDERFEELRDEAICCDEPPLLLGLLIDRDPKDDNLFPVKPADKITAVHFPNTKRYVYTPPDVPGWHLLGHPHDGCPCMECLERYSPDKIIAAAQHLLPLIETAIAAIDDEGEMLGEKVDDALYRELMAKMVRRDVEADERSRQEWAQQYAEGLELLGFPVVVDDGEPLPEPKINELIDALKTWRTDFESEMRRVNDTIEAAAGDHILSVTRDIARGG